MIAAVALIVGIFLPLASTPGATDPHVTQANIGRTICVRGYTATVRPPVSYTGPLKRRLMTFYGDYGPASGYELDHLIPLELGGAPRDPKNLWPEEINDARVKDRLENAAHRAVCSGKVTLVAAQKCLQAWPACRSVP